MLATTMSIDKNETIPDKDILFRIINDDLEAFEILVDKYKNRLINFVFRFVKDFDVAEDIVQETFLRVFKHRHNYKAIANFSTWIFTIAGNLAKSELRRRKRWKFLSVDAINDTEMKFELPDNGIKPDRATSVSILDENIQKSIDSLQNKYKESLILRDIEGMGYKKIAEITKVPVGTVKSRVSRCIKKAIELKDKYWNEPQTNTTIK